MSDAVGVGITLAIWVVSRQEFLLVLIPMRQDIDEVYKSGIAPSPFIIVLDTL